MPSQRSAIRKRLRDRARTALRKQGVSTTVLASLPIERSVVYLMRERPCPGSMADYDIDHERPLAGFDLSDAEQRREAFAPANHRWQRSGSNRRSGAAWGNARRRA